MTPVMQTRFGRGEGNCLNACVASVLDLPLGEGGVPEGNKELRVWLAGRDLGIVWVEGQNGRFGAVTVAGCGAYYLAAGTSPRDPEVDHAIVMCDGREVHDPHPERRFVAGHLKQLGFIVRLCLQGGDAA